MKNKHNGGFTLVELLVSIVILSAVVLPTCTSLVLSYRMNAKTNDLMQAQLDVSSAVETLMAGGITEDFLGALQQYVPPVEVDPSDPAGTTAPTVQPMTGWTAEASALQYTSSQFPGLLFQITALSEEGCYTVTVTDMDGEVSVTTSIRKGGGTT